MNEQTAAVQIINSTDECADVSEVRAILNDVDGFLDFDIANGPDPRYMVSLRTLRAGIYNRVLGDSDISFSDAAQQARIKARTQEATA